MIFDDVFVPRERVFLDGETGLAAVFAHSLGLWERLGGLSGMADGADLMVGLAQLVAESNGLAGEAHIKEKICSVLAGYAWDTSNPYTDKTGRRLKALAEICRG